MAEARFDQGLSDRKIAASLGVARSTVSKVLQRAATSVVWLPAELDDGVLAARVYPPKPVVTEIPLPDYAQIEREVGRPGAASPGGY